MKTKKNKIKNSRGYFLRSSLFSSIAVALLIARAWVAFGAETPSLQIDPLSSEKSQVDISQASEESGGEVLGVTTNTSTSEDYSLGSSPRDQRGVRLETYLKNRHSPMAPHADLIVSESDKYGVDYKLVVAIAYHESGLGRKCWAPHNAWGWMTSDRWDSWEEGITKYIRGLYNGYYAKGADTIDEIAPKYVMTDAWPEFVVDIKRLMAGIP